MTGAPLDALDQRLLDGFQREFPLEPRPYACLARELGCPEDEVIERLAALQEGGVVSRVGAVIAPQRAGWSTLAAMKVPPAHLEEVAAVVSSYPEVNHNYEREHELNLWFVVAAPTRVRVGQVLSDIVYRTSLEVLDLPLTEAYRLDLGFALS